MNNYSLWGQLECRHVPRPFLLSLYIWRVWSKSSMWYGIKEHQITVMALMLVACIA